MDVSSVLCLFGSCQCLLLHFCGIRQICAFVQVHVYVDGVFSFVCLWDFTCVLLWYKQGGQMFDIAVDHTGKK